MNDNITTEYKKHPTALSTPSPIRSMKNESSIQQDSQMQSLQNKDQLPLSPSLSSASSCYSQPGFAETPENVLNLPSSLNEKSLYSLSSSSSFLVFPSSAPRDTFSPSGSIKEPEGELPDQTFNSPLSKDMLASSTSSARKNDCTNVKSKEQNGITDSDIGQDKPKHFEAPAGGRVDLQGFVSGSDKLQPSLPIVDSSAMRFSTPPSVNVPKKAAASPIDDIITSPAIPIPPRSSKHTHDRSLRSIGDKTVSLLEKKSSSDLRSKNIFNLQNSSVENKLLDNFKRSESPSTTNRLALTPSVSSSVSSTPDNINKKHDGNNLEASSRTTKPTNEHDQVLSDKVLQLQSENTQLWKLVKEQQAVIVGLQNDLNAMAAKNEEYKTEHKKNKSVPLNLFEDEPVSANKNYKNFDASLEQLSKLASSKGSENNSKMAYWKHVQKDTQLPSPGLEFTDNTTETQPSPAARSLRSSRERASPITKADDTFDFQIKPSPSVISNTSTIFDNSPKHGKNDTDPVLYVTPDYLSSISLGVTTLVGKIKSSKKRREDPVAMITAYDKTSKKELWKALKDYSSFVALDSTLRPKVASLPKLPERSLFQSHAPSKVDTRKLALEEFLFAILKSSSLDSQAGLEFCKFLSSDIVDPLKNLESPHHKEGYLTMRTLLGWKMRYFVITDTQLDYFDKPGGDLQGFITLKGAMIGRQTSKNDNDCNGDDQSEKGFRHAFLLADNKKKDSVRHVLCAESDEERDIWIKTLLEIISQPESPNKTSDSPSKSSPEPSSKVSNSVSSSVASGSESISSKTTSASFSTLVAQSGSNTSLPTTIPPTILREFNSGPKPLNRNVRHSVIPSAFGQTTYSSFPHGSNTFNVSHRLKTKSSVESTSNELRPSVSLEEEYEAPGKLTKKKKGKGFFSSFRNRGSSSSHNHSASVSAQSSFNKFQATPYSAVEQKTFSANAVVNPNPTRDDVAGMHALGVSLDEAIRSQSDVQCLPHFDKSLAEGGPYHIGNRLFGIPLSDALKLSSKVVYNCTIPSIVYRCIELLKVRGAIFEEGIFRLNGSTSTIRSLKERFNKEFDIDLVKSKTFYDIHAVAGLLKLYLREMPIVILSPALSAEFRVAIDIQNTKVRVSKLNSLVKRMPKENRDLLCVLCSLLTEVISHSDVNKMNLRNIGIVFALTLNISASVLINFLTEFDDIFGGESAVPGDQAAVNLSRRPPLQPQASSHLSSGPGTLVNATAAAVAVSEAAEGKENHLPATAAASTPSPSSPSSLVSSSTTGFNAKSDELTGTGLNFTTPVATESNP